MALVGLGSRDARRVVLGVVLATLLGGPGCSLLHRHHEPERPKPIDLNTASRRKVEELPGITPTMARRIVEGRPYRDPDELVERGILTRRELERILDHIVVGDRGR